MVFSLETLYVDAWALAKFKLAIPPIMAPTSNKLKSNFFMRQTPLFY